MAQAVATMSPLESIHRNGKLGERVKATQERAKSQIASLKSRFATMQIHLPQAIYYFKNIIKQSFENRLPFPDETLLIFWFACPHECEELLLHTSIEILTPPIDNVAFQWLEANLVSSLVWFEKSVKNGEYLYVHLLYAVDYFTNNINKEFNVALNKARLSSKWIELTAIENEDIISRQDDKNIGLLTQVHGMTDFEKYCLSMDDINSCKETVDFINIYGCTAQLVTISRLINHEFSEVLDKQLPKILHGCCQSNYGFKFKPAPPKKQLRCQAKIENEYLNEDFPQCAKLLDMIRASITFDNVGDLVACYHKLVTFFRNEKNETQQFGLARIKNGFRDIKDVNNENSDENGYRDVKLNIIFKSEQYNGMNMICELQLILDEYLKIKKKSHKLYNIERRKIYFELVTGNNLPYYYLRSNTTNYNINKDDYIDLPINNKQISKDERDDKSFYVCVNRYKDEINGLKILDDCTSFQILPSQDGFIFKSNTDYYLSIANEYDKDMRTNAYTDKSTYIHATKSADKAFVFELKNTRYESQNAKNCVLFHIIKPLQFNGYYVAVQGRISSDKRDNNSFYLMAIKRAYSATPFIIENAPAKPNNLKNNIDNSDEKIDNNNNKNTLSSYQEYFHFMKDLKIDYQPQTFDFGKNLASTSRFRKLVKTYVYASDAGSGSAIDINFYRYDNKNNENKENDDDSWVEIGSLALEHKQWCQVPIVNSKQVCVAKPIGYKLMWSNQGAKREKRYAIFRPIAPKGFVSLCDVPRFGTTIPNDSPFDFDGIYCIDENFVVESTYGSKSSWMDKGTGASQDGCVFQIDGGFWRASSSYQQPKEKCYRFIDYQPNKKLGQTYVYATDAGSGGKIDINFYRYKKNKDENNDVDDSWVEVGSLSMEKKQEGCHVVIVNANKIKVAKPSGYELIWSNQGSTKEKRYAIFRPIAPKGFVSLCDVARFGTTIANNQAFEFDGIYCVDENCVIESRYSGEPSWMDRGTGASQDGSVFQIDGGFWRASSSYQQPKEKCYRLK